MIEKLTRYVSFWAFVSGIIASLVFLSLIGWYFSAKNIFLDFHRNYRAITNETLFFPTARQIDALVHDRLESQKVAVLIGGSSVMRGNGQSKDRLWSRYLQKELGDQYQVINLALNGGGPAGMASYVAEKLLREGGRVILVADLSIVGGGISPDNGIQYKSLYFDELARGYIKAYPLRDAKMIEISSLNGADAYEELELKASANTWLNFDELWNFIGYRWLFTIWTPLTSERPWAPRMLYEDNEVNCDESKVYKNFLKEELEIMRGYSRAKPMGAEIKSLIEYSVPKNIHSNLIFAFNIYSPWYLNKLDAADNDRYFHNFHEAQSVTERLGFHSITLEKDLNESDFCDRAHFSFTGGQKIAKNLAPKIAEVAKGLGYVQ